MMTRASTKEGEPRWSHGERVRHRILAEIQRYMSATGKSPTYRELAARMGLSDEAIKYHMRVLERQGFIRRPETGKAGGRGIVLTEYE